MLLFVRAMQQNLPNKQNKNYKWIIKQKNIKQKADFLGIHL